MLNIEEAIEILELDSAECEFLKRMDLKKAEQLGIEALKRELEWRRRWPHQSHLPFPGETEK